VLLAGVTLCLFDLDKRKVVKTCSNLFHEPRIPSSLMQVWPSALLILDSELKQFGRDNVKLTFDNTLTPLDQLLDKFLDKSTQHSGSAMANSSNKLNYNNFNDNDE